MTLETKREIAVHITWLGEIGILVPWQSPWNTPLLSMKKPGASDSPKSESSGETGAHCLGPARSSQPLPGQVTARAHVTRSECGRWKAEVERS